MWQRMCFWSAAALCSCGTLFSQIAWEPIGPGAGSDLQIVRFHPRDGQTIYVGGDIEGVFRSTDLGNSWENINGFLAQGNFGADVYWINDLVFDPHHPDTLYLCTGAGAFRSTDAGSHWTPVFVEIVGGQPEMVATLAVDPTDARHLYLGFGERQEGLYADFEPFEPYDERVGLLQSFDWGNTWNAVPIPLPDSTSIHTILPINADTILVVTSRGIWRSDDGGQTWEEKNSGLPHRNCYFIQQAEYQGRIVLFLTLRTVPVSEDSAGFRGGIYRSEDLGDHWIDITGNLPRFESEDPQFYNYRSFAVDPANPQHLLISPTRGSHWERAGIYETWNAFADPPEWQLLTVPNGQGWLDAGWFPDPYAADIAFSPLQPKFVAYTNVYVVLSTDRGESWEQVYTSPVNGAWQGRGMELMNVDDIAFDAARGKMYLGCDDMGLFRSDDTGKSFYRLDPLMDPVLGSVAEDGVKEIAIDPSTGNLYISRWPGSQGGYLDDYVSGGIVFSDDFGTTQQDITRGAFQGRCDLAIDPSTTPPTLYAAVYHDGIYRSRDNGSTWQKISASLGEDQAAVWEIMLDPEQSQVLWVGLNHRGAGGTSLYRSTDGGDTWMPVQNAPDGDVLALLQTPSYLLLSVTDAFDWSTAGGVYRSEDGGNTWEQIYAHPRVAAMAVHPLNDSIIALGAQQWYNVVGGSAPEIVLSTDRGNSWQRISQRLGHLVINDLAFTTLTPDRLYVATAGGGAWRSAPLGLRLPTTKVPMQKPQQFRYAVVADRLKVWGNANATIAALALYNAFGVAVYRSIAALPVSIDIKALSAGVYWLVIQQHSTTSILPILLYR